jgi:hypothetical protein
MFYEGVVRDTIHGLVFMRNCLCEIEILCQTLFNCNYIRC